ncbi:elongation of very long chain fatty acids protein AAEL008004-like [Pseudomyrmex gracilis]|uniref:elongation of very long chain fatty acids protein AAEL008004-like n=1 Tax=Pseudomyrmex gracilis TaxID=219809 RepID=UPI000994BAAC|nr:elongation of very long chain fatty acids protein AAEL008004-like [Pseudomyrmex gracilis]XP_020287671.1 elongation of very long chain fatty acids protein AAEL008004-like [Pseudomyrmex gracilis]XP_020287672.1 elongation of very long chain fatty acids protein AAEL008004-like [Pseudomyrmex gracilis]XP_020287673.1 elongation of very long chain fatty acids protein AAEL008004-like [Pseudomyrmex gracilis]XP_020287674.1 elongation of very long chain fatty acids protein AAEL008004-like [Pseudomyrmex 
MNLTAPPAIDRMSNIYNNSIVRFWDFIFHDLSDPRTHDWFLISSPVPGASIIICYLYFVLTWGPRHMKHRKPYQLKNILIVYNFCQVLLSTWLFWEGLDGVLLHKDYSLKCEPVDFSYTPRAMRIIRGVYIYFLAKFTELLDTVFFVLRKKEKQITFLHMYHHTVMPMISWGVTKYYPGGHGMFVGIINSFVHIVMYFYYLLAALLPGHLHRQYLWWKKYITTLQMVQFCLAFLHSCQLLFYDCDYPRISLVFTLPNAIFFYVMFSDFYRNAYTSKTESDASSIQNSIKANESAEKVSDEKIPNGKGKSD